MLKARQTSLDRMVAIKILSIDLADSADFIARFKREARAMARLKHPNIIQIYDFGESHDSCFIIMEYFEGVNLSQLIHGQKLTPEQAAYIGVSVDGPYKAEHYRY